MNVPKKMWYKCTTEYNSAIKKKKRNLAICNNVDGARDYDAKQYKSVRERQIPYDFTQMWNLRNKTNEQRKEGERERERERETEKQTLNYREQTDDYERGWGMGEMGDGD